MGKDPNYKLIDHTADIGIIVYGRTLEDLFRESALSLIHLMFGVLPEKEDCEKKELTVEGIDLVDLMVNWLSEILYLFEGKRRIVIDVNIKSLDSEKIEAELDTVPFDEKKHEIQCEIKAVTYHQLEISEKDKKWEAQIIFDV